MNDDLQEMIEEVYAVEWATLSGTLLVESQDNKVLLPSPDGSGRLHTSYGVRHLLFGCGVQSHPPIQMELTTNETIRMILPLHTKLRVNITKQRAVVILP